MSKGYNNYLFLFAIWPFLGLIVAINHIKDKWAANVIWVFCGFFALSLSISNEEMDINRLVDTYTQIQTQSELSVMDFFSQLYNSEGYYADIMLPLIQFTLARIGLSTEYYLTFLGLVFGYFYSRNVIFVSSKFRNVTPLIVWIFFLGFALIIPFWYINGFRFWTSAHVYIFGLLRFFRSGDKKYLLISSSSILFHFSFIFPVLVLFAYLLIGNRIKFYFIFLLFSVVLSGISIESFRNFSNEAERYLPEIYNKRIGSYASEQYVNKVRELQDMVQLNWYAAYRTLAIRYLAVLLSIFIFTKRKLILMDNIELQRWFSFFLLLFASTLLLVTVPSGQRFVLIALTLGFGFFSLVFQSKKFINQIPSFILPVFVSIILLYILVEIRIGLDTISLDTLFSNPFIIIFLGKSDLSLIELLK